MIRIPDLIGLIKKDFPDSRASALPSLKSLIVLSPNVACETDKGSNVRQALKVEKQTQVQIQVAACSIL